MAIFDRITHDPVEIDRYSFSENLKRIIVAIKKENPAFQEILYEDLFPDDEECDDDEGAESEPESEVQQPLSSKSESEGFEYLAIVRADSSEVGIKMRTSALLIEAIEFALLQELSLHLSSYFEDHDDSGDQLVELTRDDIPSVLLKNRVLALLTTPIEQRPIFRKSRIHKNPPKGTVHSIWSKDGVMFERFDLILPKGSKLDRPEEGSLVLSTERGVVRLSVDCHGFMATLPAGFEQLYLGVNLRSLLSLKVNIKIETQLKVGSLITPRGWGYYRWMDSFSARLAEEAHFPDFVARIGWDRALTGYTI